MNSAFAHHCQQCKLTIVYLEPGTLFTYVKSVPGTELSYVNSAQAYSGERQEMASMKRFSTTVQSTTCQ